MRTLIYENTTEITENKNEKTENFTLTEITETM